LASLSRHQLKQDELRTTYENFELFLKERYKEIIAVVGILAAVVGLSAGLKLYIDRQQADANTALAVALKTFHAYVGAAAPGTLGPDAEAFPTAQEKYKKALGQFNEVIQKFPKTKAAAIARIHKGECQALVGDHAGAAKTLEEAVGSSDREVASLAKLALAGELARNGKLPEAGKLYADLDAHPTSTVPRVTALLEMANAYRPTQPAQARQIYERLEKEFGSNPTLAPVLKEQISSLPK
jgi:predicted negative regulator of RcsB-dependent stress response